MADADLSDGHQTDQAQEGDRMTTDGVPLLDRSGARLRLPAEMLGDCLRMAHEISLSASDEEPTLTPADDEVMKRLEVAGILVDNRLDPVADEILNTVNQASLVVDVNLRYGGDDSRPGIWATPRNAVVSTSIAPDEVELHPVDVASLPQILGDLVVLRSPRFVGEAPISVGTETLDRVSELGDEGAARVALAEGGLDDEQATRVLRFLNGSTRHWEIVSTWSTDGGQDSAELHGLDAADDGQWLRATTGGEGPGQVTYTPQGHGEIMKAFRSVMPRNWLGTPLNRPPI